MIEDIYPTDVETVESVYRRSLRLKEDIREYCEENKEGKMGLVSHSVFLRIYTCDDDYWKDEKNINVMPPFEKYKSLRNCEFYPDT